MFITDIGTTAKKKIKQKKPCDVSLSDSLLFKMQQLVFSDEVWISSNVSPRAEHFLTWLNKNPLDHLSQSGYNGTKWNSDKHDKPFFLFVFFWGGQQQWYSQVIFQCPPVSVAPIIELQHDQRTIKCMKQHRIRSPRLWHLSKCRQIHVSDLIGSKNISHLLSTTEKKLIIMTKKISFLKRMWQLAKNKG